MNIRLLLPRVMQKDIHFTYTYLKLHHSKHKEVEIILKYFPDLTEEQRKQFAALYDLYIDWNSKINVISRKDIENLYEHHVLHSLGIAKVIQFRPGTQASWTWVRAEDFPGIPLAILFPETKISSGRQHRQESARGDRSGQCHRTEKRQLSAMPVPKRKNNCSTSSSAVP